MAKEKQYKKLAKGFSKKETIDINLLFSNTGVRLMSVFSTNLLTILIFAVIGYGLDILFGTKPLLLIILIVISFPFSIFIIIKQSKKITDKIKKENG